MQQQIKDQEVTVVSAKPSSKTGIVLTPLQILLNLIYGKAHRTKTLGIAILGIGILTFLLGIITLSAAPRFRPRLLTSGIWSGVFIIIAGSLITSTGYNQNNKCLRYGALVICIIAMVAACISGVISMVTFGIGITCDFDFKCRERYIERDGRYMKYCSEQNYNICAWENRREGAILSLFIGLLNVIVFIIGVIAAINLTNGCCKFCNTSSPMNREGVQVEQNSYCPKSHYPHQHAHLIGSEYSQQQPQLQLHPIYSEHQPIYSQQQSVGMQQEPTYTTQQQQ